MVLVLGFELPVAEFLLFLNIAMLFYIIFSMIELRDLRKLRRDLTLQLEEVRFMLKSIRFSKPPTPSKSKAPPTPQLPDIEESH